MPDRMHTLETGLPSFSGYEETEEKVDALQNYLFMLLEELRYLLRHLDAENFSESGLEALAESVAEAAGGSISSGRAVSLETLMEALYAKYGLVADLEAYRLRTDWQRAVNCRYGNRSDLHYIRIQDGEIEFITAAVASPVRTKQLKRKEVPCWWTDETRTVIGTEETAWPVMVYEYEETVTAGIRYEATPGGNRLPTLFFGSGSGSAKVYRDTDGLTVGYSTPDGEEVSLLLSRDGYVDADKMRRPKAYDFRSIADGVIRETVDGDIITSYAVEKDALGRIVKLTAADGHETTIRW